MAVVQIITRISILYLLPLQHSNRRQSFGALDNKATTCRCREMSILPAEFDDVVKCMGGSNQRFIVKKILQRTDVDPKLGRLVIRPSQIEREFLTTQENMDLQSGKAIEVDLVEPSHHITRVNLRLWCRNSTPMYVLTTNWNEIVERNNFDVGHLVHLVSFRVESKLCFVLMRINGLHELPSSSSIPSEPVNTALQLGR
ncbi:B3 domain-containing protein At2g31720-like [Dillenia turbinata]|uniref:B3 domain-containing protein At2g31720-like n=1 Tax=Dillenia turbinata TaxID=194707 RepID=A0AAN8VH09_9MAGN